MPHGIPHGEEAHGDDGEENHHDVHRMNTDGVGIDDVTALAVAKAYQAIFLLQEAEGQADGDANHSTQEANHPSFNHEDAADLLVVGTKVSEGDGILLLVDNQHRQRTDDVETGNHQDERQEDVRD